MPYRIVSGRSLALEVKRLLDQETIAATAGLTEESSVDKARRMHEARKHIKKARTLMQVARRPLGKRYLEFDNELRTANRALSPLADAHRMLDTLAATRREGVFQLPPAAFAALRARLESGASALEEAATVDDIRARTVRLPKSVRQEIATADLLSLDRAVIVGAIRDAHAASRKARRQVIKRPSVASFHRWRRRVKREWHLLRLVSELTGDRLSEERHQLAALDGCLGELHDVDVLMAALTVNSPLSRMETLRVIRPLRVHARDLRHRARRLSSVLDERPQQLVRRVRRLWGAVPHRRAEAMEHAWPHSA